MPASPPCPLAVFVPRIPCPSHYHALAAAVEMRPPHPGCFCYSRRPLLCHRRTRRGRGGVMSSYNSTHSTHSTPWQMIPSLACLLAPPHPLRRSPSLNRPTRFQSSPSSGGSQESLRVCVCVCAGVGKGRERRRDSERVSEDDGSVKGEVRSRETDQFIPVLIPKPSLLVPMETPSSTVHDALNTAQCTPPHMPVPSNCTETGP
jgi:hypothetical protein